jgi:tetratricopeptide (TPR) repeat protein
MPKAVFREGAPSAGARSGRECHRVTGLGLHVGVRLTDHQAGQRYVHHDRRLHQARGRRPGDRRKRVAAQMTGATVRWKCAMSAETVRYERRNRTVAERNDRTDDQDVIFVAMPGTIHGVNAQWTEVPEIKKYLYGQVARDVSRATGTEYRLRIEVDEDRTGNIHQSMFGAALRAPVYIADLTGLNANVYLELGVRWAVKDNVTIVTCQHLDDDLAFNVKPSKAVVYAKDPELLETACRRIVKMIVDGLQDPGHVDSLVRQGADLITEPAEKWRRLNEENARLLHQRGEDLVVAARRASHDRRVELLRQAVKLNPANLEARLELGETALASGDYGTAIDELTEATNLSPSSGRAWRGLGTAYSRDAQLDKAVFAVERAVVLDPQDVEALSVLGGAIRRQARWHRAATGQHDLAKLRQAREAYAKAGAIRDDDTYPLMNVVRLDLVLAGDSQPDVQAALANAKTLVGLADYKAKTKGDADPWKWFDLADARALTGDADGAFDAARHGLSLLETPYRSESGGKAAEPLHDILDRAVLPAPVKAAVEGLAALYVKAV